MKWISVEEELPSLSPGEGNIHTGQRVDCLAVSSCQSKRGRTKIVIATYFYWLRQWNIVLPNGWLGKDITHKVTHWQPLPELPKKAEGRP